MFPFEELCGRPVAAADYIALANSFHTVALEGVPAFSGATRSQVCCAGILCCTQARVLLVIVAHKMHRIV